MAIILYENNFESTNKILFIILKIMSKCFSLKISFDMVTKEIYDDFLFLSEEILSDLDRIKIFKSSDTLSLYLDIDKMKKDNQLKYIRSIFEITENIKKIHNFIGKLWLNAVLELDFDNAVDYIKLFREKDCTFCWFDLISIEKYVELDNNEELRNTINNQILQDLPIITETLPKCKKLCLHCNDVTLYSLVECLIIMVRPHNITIYRQSGYDNIKILHKIESYINDLIEWNIPFITKKDSYYPVSLFEEYLRKSFEDYMSITHINKKINDLVTICDLQQKYC